jgi:hypothetical protein
MREAPPEFVITSALPLRTLRARDFEECLYWLLDAMGAKDLEWRLGGSGDGAADQGRDFECSFYTSTPDADLQQEKWWIEAKGRKNKLAASTVRESVINCAGRNDIDVFVIATTSTFSNPTRDWIKEWQKSRRRPVVKLWDHTTIEKLLSHNPSVVIRLFSKALSLRGRLEVARYRFWNQSTYIDKAHLKEFWEKREKLSWDEQTLMAVLASESANGNLARHPWSSLVAQKQHLRLIQLGFLNALGFLFRAQEAGKDESHYLAALANLIVAAAKRFTPNQISHALSTWTLDRKDLFTEEIRKFITQPVLSQAMNELRDVCTNDCQRVSTDPIHLKADEIKTYWKRFAVPIGNASVEEQPQEVLTIEAFNKPCTIGLPLDRDHHCPFGVDDHSESDLIQIISHVVKARAPRKE